MLTSKFNRSTFVRQHDQADCGVACLASVVSYYGGTTSLEHLRKLSGTSKQGTTLLGLLQAAQQLGFDAEGLEAESVDNLSELTGPAILHVVMENGFHHYVVFYGFEGGKIVIGDPARGVTFYAKEQLTAIWQSKALLKLVPNPSFEKKKFTDQKKKAWILNLIREDFPLLMVSLFLGIVIAALGITTAIFSQKLIDDILPKEDAQKLMLSLILVLFLLLARSGLGYLRGIFMIQQGMNFNNRLVQHFYGNLLYLPKSFFDTRKTGEVVARLNDTRRIQQTVSALTGSVLTDALVIIISVAFLFTYSVAAGLLAVSCLLVFYGVLIWFNKPIMQLQKEVMGGYAHAESNFVDTIQGIADIKLSGNPVFFERSNNAIYGLYQRKNAELGNLGIRFSTLSEVIGVVFTISIFSIGSWQVLTQALLPGEMVALLGIAAGIVPSALRLVVANIQLQEARIAFDRMFEFTAIEKEKLILEGLSLNSYNELKIENLSFRFPGRKQILQNVSLSVNKGEMIALLGESGQGKSTLIQLIQRFYEQESGFISIDKVQSHAVSITEWRRGMSAIPQDPRIFNGSLLYNIVLNDDSESYERAVVFCERMGFGRFFKELPQGYLTLVGEEGINLSGGQKQLVVLARALFRNPKVLLLDEATSAMDRITENFVIDLLQKEKANRITIIVTHRVKTAKQCDRIYVLENGAIITGGTPEYLHSFSNFYSESVRDMTSLSVSS